MKLFDETAAERCERRDEVRPDRPVNMRAVRAFNRVISDICDVQNEAAACDRLFDGGEYSDPAHDTILGQLIAEAAERVGARFGISGEELHQMSMADICIRCQMADIYGRELFERP